jgi:hypothetical protein
MAIRYVNLAIRRDELTLLKTSVAEWEVPLLRLVHGEEMVTVEPGSPWADRDVPEVSDEYRRLEAKYRMPPHDDGRPGEKAVVAVYGQFGASPALRQAIEAATFDRPADLLGIEALEKTAADAEAVAKKAREKAEGAKAAAAAAADADSDEDDEDEETPAQRKARLKAEKAAKAAATQKPAATPGTSLL